MTLVTEYLITSSPNDTPTRETYAIILIASETRKDDARPRTSLAHVHLPTDEIFSLQPGQYEVSFNLAW